MQHPPFTALARVYDQLMLDVDYESWAGFLLREAKRRGVPSGRVLDLGCGTGNLTVLLARSGYEVAGLDGSQAMLAVAREKAPALDWHHGDFRDFALERRFALVVSVFDSLNNLISSADFLLAAARVRRHLLPGGLFLFDVNTSAGLRDLWEEGRVEGWSGEVYYRWTYSYDEERKVAEVEAFCRSGGQEFVEVHQERPYDPEEIKGLLDEAGFEEVEVVGFPDGGPVDEDAERVWVSCRAPGLPFSPVPPAP